MNPEDDNKNQGEGDRVSARHYGDKVREFVDHGEVEPAARDARLHVERHPEEAAQAERRAKYGPAPTRVSLDELIAKGRTAIERVRPIVERTVDRLRARFARK